MAQNIQKTQIEILDKSLNKLCEVKTPYPLDKSGAILRYSKELSDFGQCTFRVSAFDKMLTTYGDVLAPHAFHVRIRRGGMIVWQGAIVENSRRTKDFIEIVAAEYLFYLGKKLIHRTSPDSNATPNIYRIFNSGTLAAAVTTIMTETITDYQGNHVLAGMTLGTIENPNFPPNMTDINGTALTGPWTFSSTLTLQYDFHTILYILKAFGIYSYTDFQIDGNLVFNFKKFIGNDHHLDVNFTWGKQGNIVDYSLPRFGQRMVNALTGIATDPNGIVLHFDQSNQDSVHTYGLMEGVAAYSDVKAQGILNSRTQAELPLISTPDETNVLLTLDENSYPLGLYDIGDIVTIKVSNLAVAFNQPRRIVGLTVVLNGTGRELTTLQTNVPNPNQFGVMTSTQGGG